MLPLVSVIVVNHGKKRLLRRCLKSVSWQKYPSIEMIVVDNASKDGSGDIIREEFPEALIIQNESNELFASAVNKGIEHSKGDFILWDYHVYFAGERGSQHFYNAPHHRTIAYGGWSGVADRVHIRLV